MQVRRTTRPLAMLIALVMAPALLLVGGPAQATSRPGPSLRSAASVRVAPATAPSATAKKSAQAKSVKAKSVKAKPAKTSAKEKKRVGKVKTPKLGWYSCYGYAQCATTKLPRDYDHPKGAKVEVALLRVRASNQKKKIGSLFVNPGGPGGSAVEFALAAPQVFGPDILERFDIVGMDPRGIANSAQVKCFRSPKAQAPVMARLSSAFPYTKKQEKSYLKGTKALAKACSKTGKPLSASMSTAEVARDMDVMRRAVGDKKLSYLGFSYGTYLGQVYANLFPDRFRALAIDGVLNPVAWAGTKATRNIPQTDRIRSADGATKALHEILVRCDKAGGERCSFAPGDPVKNYDVIAERLKKEPIQEQNPFDGSLFTFGYQDLVAYTLSDLYDAEGSEDLADLLSELIIITEPPALNARSSATVQRNRATAVEHAARQVRQAGAPKTPRFGPTSFGFPYDNSLDSFTTVLCTDSMNPKKGSSWPAAAKAADRRAKYFGRDWIWSSAPCASEAWKVKDEDAYRGKFTRRTKAPMLVVGNTWDPATNYAGAVKAAALAPNSRLLSSDSWGHTAYGSSDCVTSAIDSYLLKVTLPAKNKRCVGDAQPFTDIPDEDDDFSVQRFLQRTAARVN